MSGIERLLGQRARRRRHGSAGVVDLVGLFEGVGGNAREVLLEVPGTSALRILSRAARVGFARPTPEAAFAKVREELDRLRSELASGDAPGVRALLGDLLLAVAGLAQTTGVDPEHALREATARFEQRLRERGVGSAPRRARAARCPRRGAGGALVRHALSSDALSATRVALVQSRGAAPRP